MRYDKMFNSVLKRCQSDLYIIEYDLDTECQHKSDTCTICAGTGNVIKRVRKDAGFIDKAALDQALPNVNAEYVFGKYYKDTRIAYFRKESAFDLSPGISRMVLNIVNNEITDVFNVEYMEPFVVKNSIVYYKASLSGVNIHSEDLIKTLKLVISQGGAK
jgi:hypothetical protein